MKTVFEKIKELLDREVIEYQLTEHEPVRTSEEVAKIRGVDLKTGAKAMVVKAKETFYLMILPADRRLNWKMVKDVLGVKEVRFATEEEATSVTNVEMGSVPPFGNILGLETFMDQALCENEYINFNPGSRIHSISMKCEDLVRITKPRLCTVTDGDSREGN
jgi:Ala-tRNA(Pro) deacylase